MHLDDNLWSFLHVSFLILNMVLVSSMHLVAFVAQGRVVVLDNCTLVLVIPDGIHLSILLGEQVIMLFFDLLWRCRRWDGFTALDHLLVGLGLAVVQIFVFYQTGIILVNAGARGVYWLNLVWSFLLLWLATLDVDVPVLWVLLLLRLFKDVSELWWSWEVAVVLKLMLPWIFFDAFVIRIIIILSFLISIEIWILPL